MINSNNQVLPYTDFFIAVLVRFFVNCLRKDDGLFNDSD